MILKNSLVNYSTNPLLAIVPIAGMLFSHQLSANPTREVLGNPDWNAQIPRATHTPPSASELLQLMVNKRLNSVHYVTGRLVREAIWCLAYRAGVAANDSSAIGVRDAIRTSLRNGGGETGREIARCVWDASITAWDRTPGANDLRLAAALNAGRIAARAYAVEKRIEIDPQILRSETIVESISAIADLASNLVSEKAVWALVRDRRQ